MKKRVVGLSLIERALIERDWHYTAVSAQIHALYGDNSRGMADAAGRVLYVILGAAIDEGYDAEQGDLRIVRDAVDAMHDQVGEPEIAASRRVCIVGGLEASERLIPLLPRTSLIKVACELNEKLRKAHIHLNDFYALINRKRPA